MRTSLGGVVSAIAALRPNIAVGLVGAGVVLAAYASPVHAESLSAAAEAYRSGLAEVASVQSDDAAANVAAMKSIAKRTLLAAKAKGLDVDAADDLNPGDTDYLRGRLRGVLYSDVAKLGPDAARDRLRVIAATALRRVGSHSGAVATSRPIASEGVSPRPGAEKPDSDAAFYRRYAAAQKAEKEIQDIEQKVAEENGGEAPHHYKF